MQCSGCGQSVTNGVSVCLVCGTPVPRRVSLPQDGPSDFVLPSHPDPVKPSGDNWPELVPPTSPYGPYIPADPPPPPHLISSEMFHTGPHRRRYILRQPVVMGAVAIFALLLGSVSASFAFASGKVELPFTQLHSISGDLAPQHAICSATAVETNITYVGNWQLTTGLQDIDQKNYAPIDSTSTFHLNQSVYATFAVFDDTPATLTAYWCLNGGAQVVGPYPMQIVRGSKGIAGYERLSNISVSGPASLIIQWQNKVIKVIPFNVIQ